MPTYIYKCEIHGEFEEVHSISEQLEFCPKCEEEGLTPQKVTRLIASGGTFILQNGGVGWARDKYGG
jgi:putative FmdB family regulatory protein